jgi:cell division protein FtsL
MDNYEKEVEVQRRDTHTSEVMQTNAAPLEYQPTPTTVIHNHYHSDAAPIRSVQPTTSRSSQSWVWIVIAVVAIIVICIGLYSLTGQTAKLNGSVQEQTTAIKEQTGVLGSIRDGISSMVKSIQEAIIRFFG